MSTNHCLLLCYFKFTYMLCKSGYLNSVLIILNFSSFVHFLSSRNSYLWKKICY